MEIKQSNISQTNPCNVTQTGTQAQSFTSISMHDEFSRALNELSAELALIKILIAEFKYQHAPDFIAYKHKALRQYRTTFSMGDQEYLIRRAHTLETLGLASVKAGASPNETLTESINAHD